MTDTRRAVDGIRVEIGTSPADREVAVQAAGAFARVRGAAPGQVDRVCEVARLILRWTTERAYPDDGGVVLLDVAAGDNGILVTVVDDGRPAAEFGGSAAPDSLRPLVDLTRGLRQINLGAAGNELTAVVDLPGFRPTAPAPRLQPERVTAPDRRERLRDRLVVRDAVITDAEQIASLIYECYGHDYAHRGFYRPEWIAQRIAEERLLAVVAVFETENAGPGGSPTGEIIGHNALLLEDPEGAGEIGALAVAAAYRGLGITADLAEAIAGRARIRDLPAALIRPVTHHARTQRMAAHWGFTTTALLLGAAPFEDHPRSALLAEYLILRDAPREVSLPGRYAEVLSGTYERLHLAHGHGDPAGTATATPAESTRTRAVTDLGPEHPVSRRAVERRDDQIGDLPGTARLIVPANGAASATALVDAVRAAGQSRAAVVYCDIDLHTAQPHQLNEIVEVLRDHDFFYCGLVPYGPSGHDHLRMQAMLTDRVQTDGLVLEGADAEQLLDFILTDAGPRLPGRLRG